MRADRVEPSLPDLALAVHAVRAVRPRPSQGVLVLGTGALGSAAVAVLRSHAVTKLLWLSESEAAIPPETEGVRVLALGDEAETLRQVSEFFDGLGPDFVFHCAGAPARKLAVQLVQPAGTVVLLADDPKPTRMSPNLLVFGDKRVVASTTFDDRDREIAGALLESGRLAGMGR